MQSRHGSAAPAGFTLIELMVAMAIVAILAAIAYPSYNSYVRSTKRSDATRSLLADAQMLQRCYSQSFSYTGGTAPCPQSGTTTSASAGGNYSITITVPDPNNPAPSYVISAVPVSGGSQAADTACAKFELLSSGQQIALNSANTDNTQTCWGST